MNSTELNALRAFAETMLPDICEIGEPVLASDGSLGTAVTYPGATLVDCRVAPLGAGAQASLGEAGGQIDDDDTWTLTLPHGTEIGAGWRVIWGDQTLRVMRTLGSTYATTVRAICRKGS